MSARAALNAWVARFKGAELWGGECGDEAKNKYLICVHEYIIYFYWELKIYMSLFGNIENQIWEGSFLVLIIDLSIPLSSFPKCNPLNIDSSYEILVSLLSLSIISLIVLSAYLLANSSS